MRGIILLALVFLFSTDVMAEDFNTWHKEHDKASPVWVLPKATAPSNMKWTTPSMPGDINDGRFNPPDRCSGCHSEIYEQWKGSMMANAWKDPVFIAVYKAYIKDAKTKNEKEEVAMCSRCHTPSGYLADKKGRYFKGDLSAVDESGVSCDICHSVSFSAGVGNASFIMEPGDATKGLPEIKYGPFDDSSAPHQTKYSELHTRSEFCGMCHDVAHAHNIMPIENTYTEWRTGPYNTGKAETSTHCQDCHMRQTPDSPATGSTELPNSPGYAAPQMLGGKYRGHIWQHYFIGANIAVTSLLGHHQHAKMAEDRLKNSVSIEVLSDGRIKRGESVSLRIKVINSGAGHYLPTGLTYVREMWINLVVKDSKGRKLYESGFLDEKGNIEPDAVVYKTILGEGGKERNPTFFLPAAVQVLADKRIRPKGYSIENFRFFLPLDSEGQIEVIAEVKYRSAPQFLMKELFGKDAPVLPVFTMGSLQKMMTIE